MEIKAYPRRQNNRRWGIVQFCDIERLRDEVRGVELVQLDVALRLNRGLLGRGHVVRLSHAHSTKLVGHLRNIWGRCYGLLHLGWVGAVCRLLVSHGLGLLGIGIVSASGDGLSSKCSIGTCAKLKSLASISSLLLSASGLGCLLGDWRLLLLRRIRGAIARLGVPFLGRVTPLWSCH